ncbi:hypothetical protein VIN01S_02370 [Vibrio inusitatus NBRC 102082]|uniref:Outer membrane protein beta-barrel domain-containing protein n=1 Tax=Vibrio inusitatus NBRC 102082 TaxID=1219070 RepID=A0A4Y3HQL6_9VIBR|nr:outer membrane beta-barrel protein [Vibrio inusitatus]GEA49433.1 hypothetical protein VIN01S_02370 [Vibrio inusitatus NBRC 102082]
MKKCILASALILASSTVFSANYLGLRIGGGLGTGNYLLQDTGYRIQDTGTPKTNISTDPSVVLEVGYDFNDIFAFNVKGAGANLKSNQTQDKGTIYELALEAEVGYTFLFDDDTLIKPYVAAGVVTFDKQTSKMLGENSYAETARGAIGVRTILDSGIYFDGRIQSTDFTEKGKSLSSKLDLLTEGRITVGYRF